jgi:hypothetical protein
MARQCICDFALKQVAVVEWNEGFRDVIDRGSARDLYPSFRQSLLWPMARSNFQSASVQGERKWPNSKN